MKFHDIFLHDIRSYHKKKVYICCGIPNPYSGMLTQHIHICKYCFYLPFIRSLTIGSLLHRHECLLEKYLFMYKYMVTAS